MASEARIYCLVDPETNRVRYVGSALDSIQRLRGHIQSCRREGGTPAREWLRELQQKGCAPGVRVLETVPEHQRFEAEKRWIEAMWKKDKALLNVQYCPKPPPVVKKVVMAKKKQERPELMSAAEVAALKGVHRQSVHRAFERGVLKGLRIGTTYAIERESAEAWRPIRRQYGELPDEKEPAEGA